MREKFKKFINSYYVRELIKLYKSEQCYNKKTKDCLFNIFNSFILDKENNYNPFLPHVLAYKCNRNLIRKYKDTIRIKLVNDLFECVKSYKKEETFNKFREDKIKSMLNEAIDSETINSTLANKLNVSLDFVFEYQQKHIYKVI